MPPNYNIVRPVFQVTKRPTCVVLSSELVIAEVDDGAEPVGLPVQHLPLVHPGVLGVRQDPRLQLRNA